MPADQQGLICLQEFQNAHDLNDDGLCFGNNLGIYPDAKQYDRSVEKWIRDMITWAGELRQWKAAMDTLMEERASIKLTAIYPLMVYRLKVESALAAAQTDGTSLLSGGYYGWIRLGKRDFCWIRPEMPCTVAMTETPLLVDENDIYYRPTDLPEQDVKVLTKVDRPDWMDRVTVALPELSVRARVLVEVKKISAATSEYAEGIAFDEMTFVYDPLPPKPARPAYPQKPSKFSVKKPDLLATAESMPNWDARVISTWMTWEEYLIAHRVVPCSGTAQTPTTDGPYCPYHEVQQLAGCTRTKCVLYADGCLLLRYYDMRIGY